MRVPHLHQTPAQSSFDRPASCTSSTARAATANCLCSADNSRSLLTYLPPHRASELTRPGQARMPGCQDAKMLVRSSGASSAYSEFVGCLRWDRLVGPVTNPARPLFPLDSAHTSLHPQHCPIVMFATRCIMRFPLQ
ncbi:hypothetical protein V8C44DRAFT_316489 [Trichoderma aethiopicum]